MRNRRRLVLSLLGLAMAGTAFAQTVDATKFYKLEFVVKELEGGKVVNARSYSTLMNVQQSAQERSSATIRTGGRVPVSNSNGEGFSYLDVGVNLDCSALKELQTDVSLFVTADISSISQDSAAGRPAIRQNKWSSTVVLPIKKSTVIFASDDVTSKRQMQLELTATPIK
jgi:hypothetical protein